MKIPGKISILLLLLLVCKLNLTAQKIFTITGIVQAAGTGNSVTAANILVYQPDSSGNYRLTKFTTTDIDGRFSVSSDITSYKFKIVVSHVQYIADTVFLSPVNDAPGISMTFKLTERKEALSEVIITNNSIRIKGDTIEYLASAFQKIETRKVEDLLRNIEGFSISSTGKISYRGKEIKAVLINGENLTKEQYEILTKNLNAGIVEQIQVFDNFSENRIIGSLFKTGDAAINLKLKSELEGKMSGGIAAGTSFSRQQEADLNLLWLKGSIKSVNLFNYNSIARPGYKESTTGSIAFATNPEYSFIDNLYRGTGLIVPPSLTLPSVAKTYLNRNDDVTVAPLLHVKLSNVFKFALRYSSIQHIERYEDRSASTVIIDPVTRWEINNNRSLRHSENLNYLSLNVTHDNNKKFAGELLVQVATDRNKHDFRNPTSGAVLDTLTEQFNFKTRALYLQYKGAISLNRYNVFATSLTYDASANSDRLLVNTNRYNKYWTLLPHSNLISQNLLFDKENISVRNTLMHGKGKTSLSVSLNHLYQSLSNSRNIISVFDKTTLDPADTLSSLGSAYRVYKWNSHLKLILAQQLGNELTGRITGGIGVEEINGTASRRLLAWDTKGDIRWKFKAFSSLSLTVSSVSSLPPLNYFVKGVFIQTNAGLFSGTNTIEPIRYNKAELGFNTFRLLTGTSFQVSVWGKQSARDYLFASNIDTSVYILYPFPVTNNWEYGTSVSGRTYIFPIKSTVSATIYLRKDKGENRLNEENVINKQTGSLFTASYLSKFNFPFNIELTYSKNFTANEQSNGAGTVQTKNRWDIFSAKSRLQFGQRFYIGTDYSLMKFTGQRSIQLFDAYSAYIFSKKISMDIKLHNIFDTQRFEQNNISPNSFTTQSIQVIGRYLFLRATLAF